MNWSEREESLKGSIHQQKQEESRRLADEANSAQRKLNDLGVDKLLASIGNQVWKGGIVRNTKGWREGEQYYAGLPEYRGWDGAFDADRERSHIDRPTNTFYGMLKSRNKYGYAQSELSLTWPFFSAAHEADDDGYWGAKSASIEHRTVTLPVVVAFRENGKFAMFCVGTKHVRTAYFEALIPEEPSPKERLVNFLTQTIISEEWRKIDPEVRSSVDLVVSQLKHGELKNYPLSQKTLDELTTEDWIKKLLRDSSQSRK